MSTLSALCAEMRIDLRMYFEVMKVELWLYLGEISLQLWM